MMRARNLTITFIHNQRMSVVTVKLETEMKLPDVLSGGVTRVECSLRMQ